MNRARLGWYALALCGTAAFAALGTWQLDRAHQKERALAAFAAASSAAPRELSAVLGEDTALSGLPRRVRARGHYDDATTVLLDNQVLDGKPGLDVLTLFVPEG